MITQRIAVRRTSLAYAAFVLYGSLMPWRWRWRPFDDALSGYLGLGEHAQLSLSYSDFATNLALFAVLALLWSASLATRPASPWGRFAVVLAGGSLFSAGIEFAQLYTPQRTSSIYDWVANSLGAAIGAGVWVAVGPRLALYMARAYDSGAHYPIATARMRRATTQGALPYVVALGAASHWYSVPWLSWREAAARAAEINLLPFFYHQEASTFVALASVLWQVLLYAPLGAAVRTLTSSANSGTHVRARFAALAGAGVSAVMEGGRLFVAGQHPDMGNVVVASLAAAGGFTVCPIVCGLRHRSGARSRRDSQRGASATPSLAAAQSLMTIAKRALSLALVAAVAVTVFEFPVLRGPLAVALLLYAIALLRWPWVWLWVLPAALPVLDLAPLSGRFFFDECDLLVLTTLTVSLWRRASDLRQSPAVGFSVGAWLWAAFAVSVALGTLLGVLPLQRLDANAFATYYSHYNALRIAKGFLSAFLLIGLLHPVRGQPADMAKHFTGGMLIGLAGATSLALWERQIYPGLLDFSQGHRVGAFFSSMHNGGSHIEAYFVTATPFVLAAAYQTKSARLRLAAAALLVAATYILMVTFARGGYAAFALSMAIAVGLIGRMARVQRKPRFLAWIAVGLVVAAALVGTVISGKFAQQRLASSATDLGIRTAHWREAVRIMDPGFVTSLFGMGLGRFPETYYYRNLDHKAPATFRYESDGDGNHLKLGSGEPVYVEQFVDVGPRRDYRLALDLRSAGGPVQMNVLLCARTYFMSYGCEAAVFRTASAGADWRHYEATIRSNELGSGSWLWRRPVKLSLENATPGTTVDVRGIELDDADGRNLVSNGDFSKGSDHWFFSSNFNHLPWHIKNLWVGLYFELGLFGIAMFSMMLAHALGTLIIAAWRCNPYAAAALASAIGFLCVGLVDSLFDAPRLTTLFLLVLAVGSPWRRTDTVAFVHAAHGPVGRRAPATVAAAARVASAVSPSKTGMSWDVSIATRLTAVVAIVALAAAIATRLPQVPYNARKLLNPYHPLISPLAFALFVVWVTGLPMLVARWLQTARRAGLLLPVVVVLQAVVAWALVRQAVLPVMIHKVAGAPILGWPWEWETLLRFCALQSTLFLLLTGGCIVKRVAMQQSDTRPLLTWLCWSAFVLPLLNYAIVGLAATDNLTELMAGGGGALSSSMLALWWVLVGAIGALFGDVHGGRRMRAGLRLCLAVLSIPLGYLLLWLGLEPDVSKYETSFSALQFLFSANRQSYAAGWELGIRYALFHSGVIGLMALAQFPFSRRGSRI